MKKSDIFTPHFPAPTDSDLYPFYKKYIAFKKEIAQQWKQEFLTGMIGFRAYADLQDVRLSVKHLDDEKDPAVVISLKPVVGQEIKDEFAFYLHTFRTYRKLVTEIHLTVVERRMCMEVAKPDASQLQFLARSVITIQAAVSATRLLLMAANHEVLTRDHLDVLDKVDYLDGSNVEQINAMINGLGFSQFFSDKFQNGGDYYDHPEQELVDDFYKWSDKRQAHGGKKG